MWWAAHLVLCTAIQDRGWQNWSAADSFPNALCGVACVGLFAELLPNPPVTRNQLELMQIDNVASPQMPGFRDLGISPSAVEQFIRHLVGTTQRLATPADSSDARQNTLWWGRPA
jgi:hypothetical protein